MNVTILTPLGGWEREIFPAPLAVPPEHKALLSAFTEVIGAASRCGPPFDVVVDDLLVVKFYAARLVVALAEAAA